MRQFTLGQRLRYGFDNVMAQGTIALLGWLALASLVMIVTIALIARLTPEGEELGLAGLIWMGLMRTLDTGTMGGDTGSPTFLGAMLAVTLGGVFLVGTLIGVLTAGVEGKLAELRKGRSFVAEHGHTVILGWNEQVFSIITELVIANANQKRSCVVILADQDKVVMEDALRAKIASTGRTRIVCRSGNPIDLADLEIVNLPGARAIIVLSPDGEDPDSQVIKTILAITNNPTRRPEPYHVVAEIRERKNMEAARLVGGDETQLVEIGDVISRIIVQTCRQSGLSVVYTELLDFGGDEIYFHEEPALVGRPLGDALLAYESSAVIGLQFAGGRVALKPPLDTVIQPGDRVIAISADDDTVRLSGRSDLGIEAAAIQTAAPLPAHPEHTLILGWNRRAPAIINELDHYVAAGSSVTVVADYDEGGEEIAARCPDLRNQTVTVAVGDTTDRTTLQRLDVGRFQHIIVLCYSDLLEPQRADARTLVTLLHLRDLTAGRDEHVSIVSEMLDIRNRQLAEVTRADDFIVSDRLISLMLAQISENKHLTAVFEDIFDPEGAEIYLKPAGDYVAPGRPVNFYTIAEAARRRDQIAIGYRLAAQQKAADKAYGVRVNPPKSELVTFEDGDRVIVIAEE
jgi:voltage-gated potassium channel Kch